MHDDSFAVKGRQPAMATVGERDAAAVFADEQRSRSSWSVHRDPTTGEVIARFPSHVSSEIAIAAIAAIAKELRQRAEPSRVVADLVEVDGFDVTAPIAAVGAASSIVGLIERVDIIVRSRLAVGVAALSAAHILGLKCTIRYERRQ